MTALLDLWGRYARSHAALAGLAVLALIITMAVAAPIAFPDGPHEMVARPLLRPLTSLARPLGTDALGRDMLSRLIFGARLSLFIGLAVMLVSALIGTGLGLLAAFAGGVLDVVILRIMDLIMAIPSLVLAILIVAVLGPSLTNTIIAITAVYLPRYVRLMRASAIGEMQKDYVTAAKVAGAGPLRVMLSTVLPNCLAPLIVQGALGISDAILEAAGLGFLGLGAQPPAPEWGAMLADSREFLQAAPWIVTLPGLAILVTVLAINVMGDGLRDALDPKLRRG